jgi:methyl-accepting chemotaxis protein
MAIGPEIASFVARDPAGRAALSDVLTEMGDYRRFFEETRALQAESDALVADVEARERDLGRVFDAMMSSARASGAFDSLLSVADAKDGMLSALNAFENFLVHNDPDHFAAMEQEIRTARAALDRLAAGPPGPIALGAAEARAFLGAYAAAAAGAREAILSRNGTRAAIDGLGTDLMERLDAALNHEVARQAAITTRNRSILNTTMVLLGVISLAAVAASAAFALSAARRVRAAIEMSVSEMQELAGGNLAVEITGADRDHELGRMAQALVVFRDNAQAVKALEAQQAEQERAARLLEEEQARRQAAAEEESRRQAAEARAKMIAELRDGLGAVVDGAAAGDFSRRITERFAEDPSSTAWPMA